MPFAARLALAFALSFAAAGALQQAFLMAFERGANSEPLVPLGFCILAIAFVFGVVVSWRPSAGGWTAAIMLAAMLVFGVVVYHLGVNSRSPGMGGDIGYGVAMIVVFYFLLPSALAVPIHWWLLRGAADRK